jgi:hypothetical protein
MIKENEMWWTRFTISEIWLFTGKMPIARGRK